MIPEAELARALARWKARKLGLPAGTAEPAHDTGDDIPAPVFEENTRVARAHYPSEMETPPAEVHLSDEDFEDHSKTRVT